MLVRVNKQLMDALTQEELEGCTHTAHVIYAKGNKPYANDTIVKQLNITRAEQKQMVQIMDKQEAQERRDKRENARKGTRNDYFKRYNALKNCKSKVEKIEKQSNMAKEMKKQGMTVQDIADTLKISLSTAKRLLNK